MANTSANARRVEEGDGEKEVPPTVTNQDQHQVPPQSWNHPPIGNATVNELRDSMKLLPQALMVQANRKVVALINHVGGMGAFRFDKEKGSGSLYPKTTCSKCGRSHYSQYLAGMDGFYVCGKDEHRMRDCPVLMAKGREDTKVVSSDPSDSPQKKNRFYALQYKKDEK
ncbi:hypothetical protein EJD97_002552 [Solanum chilense]|uniref:CCHC-type domain-containing protein n=1 Tax=Solanum chilense TaxID=4083 RepID=A0A6N2BXT7_SOLCI|nr:hypothetical protein EJD97_002552 [Solanum chilense]